MGRSLFLVGLPAATSVVTAGLAFLGDLAPVTGVVTTALVVTNLPVAILWMIAARRVVFFGFSQLAWHCCSYFLMTVLCVHAIP